MAPPGANATQMSGRFPLRGLSAHDMGSRLHEETLRRQDKMTTFEERERGFEKKFALDQEQEFKATARRNRALGKWAAGLMGLEAAQVDEYAKAVVKSDFELPGDDDVLRKVFEDLKGAGVNTSEADVRMKMAELLAQAREGVRNGA